MGNSLGSGAKGSLNTGSMASDSFNSASSGSNALASWGFQLQIWQWVVLVFLILACLGAIFSLCGKKKPKKKSTKKKPAAAPAPAPVAPQPAAAEAVEPLLPTVPPLMPLATTSQLIPSYSMAAPAPMYSYQMAAPQAAPIAYETFAQPQV